MVPLRGDLTDPATLRDLPRDVTRLVFPRPVRATKRRTAACSCTACSSSSLHCASAVRCNACCWLPPARCTASMAATGSTRTRPARRWRSTGRAVRGRAMAGGAAGMHGGAAFLRPVRTLGRTRLIDMVASGRRAHAAGCAAMDQPRARGRDAAAACAHVLALARPASCYVVSDDTPAGIDEVYAFLAQRLGLPPPHRRGAARARRGQQAPVERAAQGRRFRLSPCRFPLRLRRAAARVAALNGIAGGAAICCSAASGAFRFCCWDGPDGLLFQGGCPPFDVTSGAPAPSRRNHDHRW